MSDATPTPDSTGQAPATPGASAPDTTPQAQAGSLLTDQPQAAPDTAPVDTAKPADAAPAALVIPDKYEFKPADGIELDTELLEAISPVFKELELTQEKAQKLVDQFNDINTKLVTSREAAAEKQFKDFMAQTAKDNVAAIKKEWGNDFQPNLAIAQRGMARTLSDAGKKKLEDSGLGNDPEFMKAFYQVGKMIQEDQPPSHTQPHGTKPATLAQALYPS